MSLFRKNLFVVNALISLVFFFLVLAWLALKLKVAQELSAPLSFFSIIDLVRSQLSIDLAFFFLFTLSVLAPQSLGRTLANTLLFLLMSFYFLKLTGLYAYTRDATPYSMIEFGSYLLNLPFAGATLTALAFIVLPISLSIFLLTHSLRSNNLHPKLSNALIILVPLLIIIGLIPPLQKQFYSSLSFHPYIYSLHSIWNKKLNNANEDLVKRPASLKAELSEVNGKNIVFITLESLRKDAVNQEVMPFLHKLSKASTVYNNAFASIPHTSKALVAIHCGQAYISPYLFESTLGLPQNCIAHRLKNSNYASAFFQSATGHFENRGQLIKQLGFDNFYSVENMDQQGFEIVNYFSFEDDIMLNKSKEWLLEHLNQGTILTSYLTGTTHHNYNVPSDFKAKKFSLNRQRNKYLNAASYTDQFIQKLIQQYKDLGLYENTIFLISSDHGEGFGEHRPLLHNNNLYNEALAIPLIIHKGYAPLGKQINTLVSQTEISGIAQAVNALSSDNSEAKTILSSCWYSEFCYALLQQEEDQIFKLILDLANERRELYQIKQDPYEKSNLVNTHSALSKHLEKVLIQKVSVEKKYYNDFYQSINGEFLGNKANTFSTFKSLD